MDLDDLLRLTARTDGVFGLCALWVWLLFPHPDSAVPRDMLAGRTKLAGPYRTVWRTGQAIGWTCAGVVLLWLAWTVYGG